VPFRGDADFVALIVHPKEEAAFPISVIFCVCELVRHYC
jgi:hypothetical protein